jgi:protein-L-isoaspartate(D-aspartate) O-methyltransferase
VTTTAPHSQPVDAQTGSWRQLLLTTDQPAHVETLLIELAPLLHAVGQHGPRCWWIRKGDTLRLRLWHPDPDDVDQITATVRQHGAQIHPGIYEPETHGFGGEAGIRVAHRVACQDAHHLAGHLARHRQHHHRHEMFLLLATRLMRAAGLDLEEQGDVWARVAAHRPKLDTASATTRRAVRHLIFSGPDSASSPLYQVPSWSGAVETAGRDLARLAATGRLTRGVRAVIANLLLFMANRHGIHSRPLAIVSTAAQHVIFQEDHHMAPSTETLDPVTLRDQLADAVRARDLFSGPDSPVERAFRTVFRHEFLPGTPLGQAYGPRQVVTKRAADGSALSSASAPPLVARMLEQLAAKPGERILEIGAATGFNAALLGELVGPDGQVVTIEYDQDLADGAADAIARTGYNDRVEVRHGDGALGAPDRAPYDGIIVTAGAVDVPAAWWDQLTDQGRMIVPLELHPCGLTRSVRLHRTGCDTAVSTHQLVCGFVPMRGQSAVITTRTRLADDILLDHAPADITDTAGLAQSLVSGPSWQRWTGLSFGMTPKSAGHLDLWLATQQPIPFGRLSVSDNVREAGIADPTLRWSGATLFRSGSLAYLTTRDAADGEEIGIAAHGPAAQQLGSELLELTRTWHCGPRLHEPTITITRNHDNSINLTVHWTMSASGDEGGGDQVDGVTRE